MAEQSCDWLFESLKLLNHSIESDLLRILSESPVDTALSGENDVFANARHKIATVKGLFVSEQVSKLVGTRLTLTGLVRT